MYTLKKSLGQHFLTDESVCRKIVSVLLEDKFQKLLEVGPGGGALTKYLLQLEGIDFKCVEVDEEKVNWLLNTFPKLNGRIIHESFLDMQKPFDGNFAVTGNFPYNISSQIVFRIVEWRESIDCMIGMFQKEVALRIAATEGNKVYGVISVLVQGFFNVDYLFEVGENSFNPPPKVKSAVIRLKPRAEKIIFKDERSFFLLVKTAFNQRRKMLKNATRALFDNGVLQEDIFSKRAEQLSVKDFASLTFKMK